MTTKKKLNILGDDEGNDNFSLSINSSYAKRYDDIKKKQEMSQLEDKYKAKLQMKGITKISNDAEGDEDSSDYTDSESDEEEDDEGELLTPAVDAQILKTLSEIRARSEKVYDPSTKFFDEAELAKIDQEWRKKHAEKSKSISKPDSKPSFTVKDYQRERILSGKVLESEDEEEEPQPLTHVQEQELLKAEMKKAFSADVDEYEGEEGSFGILNVKVKTEEEIAEEEEEYRNFLLENLASSENAKLSMGEWLSYREEHDGVSRKEGKSKKQLTDDDFLIDYVLNKGWVDKQASKIPSYEKIIEEDLKDEEAVEVADEFEMAHNFRYEQEGGAQIQTFSRNIEGSMRREESSRKEQRKSAKERKAQEKVQKSEELKRLKNLKMAEIKKKLEKITNGKSSINVEEFADDFDGDFDPERHDKLMQKLVEDEEAEEEDKPVFSSDSEIDFTSDEEEKKPAVKKATKALKKAAKKSQAADASEESEKARLSKYLDELYNMDYEDLIGDIPCRFKYQQVEPSTFGLSLDEILTADDKQLNSYFSLKKLAPYRPADKQEHDIEKYASKHRLYKFRKSLKESLYGTNKKAKHNEDN
jgi:protein KRI1